jgi:hypothetical protein
MRTMANTHIVTKTTVVQLENGAYGVKFEFDDGYADLPRSEARRLLIFTPRGQIGEAIVCPELTRCSRSQG